MDGSWDDLSVGIVKSTWGVQNVVEGTWKGKWELPDVVSGQQTNARRESK